MAHISHFTQHMLSLQISAIKGMIGELRAGVSRVNSEILKASGIDGADDEAAAAHERFSEVMVGFQEGASAQFSKLEVRCALAVLAHTRSVDSCSLLLLRCLAMMFWISLDMCVLH